MMKVNKIEMAIGLFFCASQNTVCLKTNKLKKMISFALLYLFFFFFFVLIIIHRVITNLEPMPGDSRKCIRK